MELQSDAKVVTQYMISQYEYLVHWQRMCWCVYANISAYLLI